MNKTESCMYRKGERKYAVVVVLGLGGVGIRESKQRERTSFNSGPLTGS